MRASDVTPGRTVKLVLDSWTPHVVASAYNTERDSTMLKDIAVKGQSKNIEAVPEIGLMLRPMSYVAEISTGANAGVQTVASGAVTVATNFAEFNEYKRYNGTGAGYDSSVVSAGLPIIQKRTPAGTSEASSLSSDQTAFPGPDISFLDGITETAPLDRVMKTAANWDFQDDFSIKLVVPAGNVDTGPICKVYFPGLAGKTRVFSGDGQYCLAILGNGRCYLYEHGEYTNGIGTNAWRKRKEFQWSALSSSDKAVVYIRVLTDAIKSPNEYYIGNTIGFYVSAFPATYEGDLAGQVSSNIVALTQSGVVKYRVPGRYKKITDPATTAAPIRFDLRRDIRAQFRLIKHRYPSSGTFADRSFAIPRWANMGAVPFIAEWHGALPANTGVTVALYDDTNHVLIGASSYSTSVNADNGHYFAQYNYSLPSNCRLIHLEYTLTTSDGESTPLISLLRYGRGVVTDTPPLEASEHEDAEMAVMINDQAGEDPQQTMAQVTVRDLTDAMSVLRKRSHIPAKIVSVDNNTLAETVLFSGYVVDAPRRLIGHKNQKQGLGSTVSRVYPSPKHSIYDLKLTGEWQRLAEQRLPERWTWIEGGTGLAYKITDFIKWALARAGYSADQIDVPDIDIRFFDKDSDANDWKIEPDELIIDHIPKLVQDFLGGYFIWDANAGTGGMWRVMTQKQSPYTPLARFTMAHPGQGILPHVLGSHGTVTVGSYSIPVVGIKGRTYGDRIEPPECNHIRVRGGSKSSSENAEGDAQIQYVQDYYNVKSCNFLSIAEGDPGYPDPMYIDYIGTEIFSQLSDATLSTQNMVNYACKRTAAIACHGRHYVHYEAPLVFVTDPTDAHQRVPRPLRFYDIVQLEDQDNPGTWLNYIVAQVNTKFKKSYQMWADYTLVRPSNLDTDFAVWDRSQWRNYKEKLAQYIAKQMGSKSLRDRTNTIAHRTADYLIEFWTLETVDPGEFQDMDPTSETFGDVLWTSVVA